MKAPGHFHQGIHLPSSQIIDPALALELVRNEEGPIAYDTETTGLTIKDTVCGYVITNVEYSIYVPVRHGGGGNIPRPEAFEASLAKAFDDRSRYGYLTVGHNLGFDLRISLRHGIRLWHPLEDTMINEGLINDLTVGYGLNDCAIRRGVTPKKGDALYRHLAELFGGLPDRKSMQHFWKLAGDDPIGVDYATGDGISTLELWEAQRPWLAAEVNGKTLLRVHELECQLLPYLARMHNRGIKVDTDYAERVLDPKNLEGLPAKIKQASENFDPGFNPRSPKEVEALYRANGYGDDQFASTATGKVSFTENWLGGNEIGQAINGIRKLEKLRDSFITPLVATHNIGGRVHPILNQSKSDEYGVAGARLSCSEPNLQAQPKRDKVIGKLVRPLLIPDFGNIYEDDFQQQEPRLFTHFSEQPELLGGYRAGTMDIHDRVNDMLFDGQDRDKAKRLGMGMLTMLGLDELARRLGCTRAVAKRYKAQFLDVMPEIGKLQRDIIATFADRGVVFTILGRRSYLESQRFAYQGVSRVIQNNGGDHMKLSLLKVNQYEDAFPNEFQMLMTIHDSSLFQTDSLVHATEAQRLLESTARDDLKLILDIPVEVGFGANWSEASYIKRGVDWYTAPELQHNKVITPKPKATRRKVARRVAT